MKFKLLLLLLIFSVLSKAQDAFQIDSIRSLYLNFYDVHWRDTLDYYSINNSDLMVLANLTINGITYDSVGVRFKGNSSNSPGQIKNPFHIELDTIKNQDFMGVTTFKLSNGFKDPSFVREVMSYEVLGNYMACPKSNFVQLYADGALIGLYTNNQTINKDFVEEHFFSRNNPRFKCDPVNMGGPPPPPPEIHKQGFPPHPPFPLNHFKNGQKQLGFGSSLFFIANDSTSYYPFYQLKSDYGWTQINNLINILNNDSIQIESILDVDRVLWMLAWNNIFVNMDSYTGSGHNYYIYQNDSNRFCPIIWDLNENFGTFTSGLSTTELKQLSPFYGIDIIDRPLISNLLSNPDYRKRYLAHFKTLKEEIMDSDYFIQRAQSLQTMIDSYVQNDPNKLFTYTDFQNNITQPVGNIMGIEPFLHDRKSYLDTVGILQPVQPGIQNAQINPISPIYSDSVIVTTKVVDAEKVFLCYTTSPIGPFIKIQIFDNGSGNDTIAGDSIYTGIIPAQIANTTVRYYIYAENLNMGRFYPRRAEYEVLQYTVAFIFTGSDVVINEFCARNNNTQMDYNSEYDDWIELYNNSNIDISLQGMYITDDFSNLFKYQLPDITIQANSYLIIWADSDLTQTGIHSNFKLSANGEELALVYANGNIADLVSFPVQYSDTTYGRYPNGTGSFQYLYPTFNAVNTQLGIWVKNNNDFDIYPNPTKDRLYITQKSDNPIEEIKILGAKGNIINTISPQKHQKTISISLNKYPNGIYFITIGDASFKIILSK